ncbi:MAG: CBS domain-containing protein [Opitutales bacterium]|nr:CBS domain-containing protein [Opitutales bacterium]
MEINTPVSRILNVKGSTVHSISPEATVSEAVKTMNEKKIGSLLVVHMGKPVGMFTERDVLTRVVDTCADPKSTKVRDVMTSQLVAIRPSLSIEDTMRIITQKRCRHLPVVEDGVLLGMISIGDVMRWFVREHEMYIENLLDYINGAYPG